MGKKRNEETYIEKLEKEVRELKSLNRTLIKRLRKVDKGYNKAIEDEKEKQDQELEKEFNVKKEEKCPECGKGRLVEIAFGPRVIRKCTLCTYRKTQKV